MAKTEYIVLCGQVVGNTEQGFDIVYGFDGERFDDRELAIRHGFQIRKSDDFNIGVLKGRKLTSLDWMEEPVETDVAELKAISAKLWL